MIIHDLRAAAEADAVSIHLNYTFDKMLHSRNQALMRKFQVQRMSKYINHSRASDVSDFIGSDENVVSYHLVVF